MNSILEKNRKKADQYHKDFKRVFGISLMNYFNFFFGFDVIKFDEDFVKPNEGESTSEAIKRAYGKEGVEICQKLLA